MKRIIAHIRLFAVAVLALLAVSVPALSAHAAPSAKSIQCDKAKLSQAHNEAIAAVGYLNYLKSAYTSSALNNAYNEEQHVVDTTKDCNHLSKAFDNAYKASGDYYTFYYNVVPANGHNAYTESAKQHITNAYNLVETVYGTAH